jgi:hypothetical protein
MDNSNNKLLEHILETRFYAEAVENYDSLTKYLRHPNFPNREKEFRQQITEAITKSTISPERYEKLTGHELETQKEVNEFLLNEIWKPLYSSEALKS